MRIRDRQDQYTRGYARMRHLSPLRYPGGKRALATLIEDVIDLNDLRACSYYEPFAGGAGAALALLQNGVVSKIHVNDADFRVYSFWQSVLSQSERFADRISFVPLTIDEWRNQQTICENPQNHNRFEVGFSAFYMNRCNRSGVLSGAGPIGGYKQAGQWRLDARFNREILTEKVLQIGRLQEQIHVTGMDAIRFLSEKLPYGRNRKNVLVYLDPPYVKKGQRLYLNAYEKKDHILLSKYLLRQQVLPWIMSYDDSELVRTLYGYCKQALLPIRYTLQNKRNVHELIIAPNEVTLPTVYRYGSAEYPLEAVA